MIWLTDEERADNERRDREAKSRGYRSAYDETEAKIKRKRDGLVESARRKLTREEFAAVQDAARERQW